MNEILLAAVALPTLGTAVLVWGFAPDFVNRLFASIYPADDARRSEIIAELYSVPRWEQPFRVAQQAERAISEGIPSRLRARRARIRASASRVVVERRQRVYRQPFATAESYDYQMLSDGPPPNLPGTSLNVEMAAFSTVELLGIDPAETDAACIVRAMDRLPSSVRCEFAAEDAKVRRAESGIVTVKFISFD